MPAQLSDYPYADTEAAQALRSGLDAFGRRADKVSLREVGRRLGYKQPVVLSHMASGRAPIPVERATQLAAALELDERSFLSAVLRQRYPEVQWVNIFPSAAPRNEPDESTGTWLGASGDRLSSEQKKVLRELLRDTRPQERWLSVAEIPTVSMIRSCRPDFPTDGLSRTDYDSVKKALGSEETHDTTAQF